jgi:membrane-associated phospholipid phosphatase
MLRRSARSTTIRKLRLLPLIRAYGTPLGYLAAWTPYIALYQLTNRCPLRTPVELPFTALDRVIPFVPELLPVYVSYLALFLWTGMRSENDREANRLFYCTYFQLLLSAAFFVAYPVRMPRELFYGAESFGWADTFWRWFDGPHNCFPSLHTSNALLFLELNWSRPRRGLHAAASVAVIGSTVFVKQHYVVDVVGGVAVYLVTRALSARVDWEALPVRALQPARAALPAPAGRSTSTR